jgi:DNA-binding CsgD family transcriptional regulator
MKTSKFVPAGKFLAGLSPAQRAEAKARAKAIVAEELTLADLRKSGELTQAKIGAKLNISQDQVSRLEKRADILISTLNKYVAAMGGSVHIMVQFPGKAPVKLAGLEGLLGRGGRGPAKPKPRTKAA